MSTEEFLSAAVLSLQANATYSEAVLLLRDDSQLCFCHRVDERWAKAVTKDGAESEASVAGRALSLIAMFRLNAKHLDIQFEDGSRWEFSFRAARPGAIPPRASGTKDDATSNTD
jgi:hypothetical protein